MLVRSVRTSHATVKFLGYVEMKVSQAYYWSEFEKLATLLPPVGDYLKRE